MTPTYSRGEIWHERGLNLLDWFRTGKKRSSSKVSGILDVKAWGVAKPAKKTYSYGMTNKPLAYVLIALITGAVGFGVAKIIGLFV